LITRHYVDVGPLRVHYRRAGSGPALVLVHQSPRSSAEYDALIAAWSEAFTVIAPDTPGFGQSDPLPGLERPEVGDYADALVALLDALGLERVGGYGFHSGAIILITAARRYPDRFAAVAANGYAVWTPEEREIFGERYTPAFRPQAYGEHLTWAWNRILEQSWFFPWYDVRQGARLGVAHDDPRLVNETVMDLLAAGDAYRLGYSAVLRAPRDLPPPDFAGPPVLLTAAEPDPLHAHLGRIDALPANWTIAPGPTRTATDSACRAHLAAHPAPPAPAPVDAADAGFVAIVAGGFDGLIHWRGSREAERVLLPAPGRAADAIEPAADQLAIDLPGHGLSADFPEGMRADLSHWSAVAAAAVRALAPDASVVAGEGWSGLLAIDVAGQLGRKVVQVVDGILPATAAEAGIALELPDLAPDRFGGHLARAWQMVRAREMFWPWFRASAASAIPFTPDQLAPDRLARNHLAALRARRGRELLACLTALDRARLCSDAALAGIELRWPLPDWTAARPDVWRPAASTI
jgi:pimeloyl-ACP methyl ester carboxylesterase